MYKYVQCTHIFICMYRACEYYMPNSFVNSVYWNSLLLFDIGARPKIVNNSYFMFSYFLDFVMGHGHTQTYSSKSHKYRI